MGVHSDIKTTRLTATGFISADGQPARLHHISGVSAATAGTIVIRDGGATGTIIASFDTPALATEPVNIPIAGLGLRGEIDLHVTMSVVAILTFQWTG